jgi:hypothetical protein
MRSWIPVALIALLSASAFAQHTKVTAQVLDPTGVTYRNCTGSANFVGQNTTPGAGPYLLGGSVFQTVVPISCDSFGKFTISLADNNQISPTPSQWNFAICSALNAYPGPPLCFNTLITITGTMQNVTTALQSSPSVTLPPYAIKLETNGTPNGSQALLNLIQGTNVTITDNGLGGVTISSSGGGGGGGLPPFGTGTSVTTTNLVSATPGDCAVWGVGNVLADSPCPGGGGIVGPPSVSTQVVGNGFNFVSQPKANYDIRDWGFTCDGTTYNTSAATTLVNSIAGAPANVQITQQHCGMGDFLWPKTITLDFSTGGTLKPLTDSTTVPGHAAYDSTAGATGHCESNNTSTTCSMAVTAVANDTYALVCMRGFSSGIPVSATSTAASDLILPWPGSSTSFTSITVAYMVPNVTAGGRTFVVTFPSNLVGACTAVPISGAGPTPWLDGAGAICSNCGTASPMSAGPATFLSGSFLLAFGGNNNTTETCTAGAGFVMVPGAAGCSTNTNSHLGVEYQNSSSAGSTTATMAISPSPAGHGWSFELLGLRPASGRIFPQGGINNPANAQIFENATGSAGVVDFTGNLVPLNIYPEWWGASSLASDSTNLAALQASEHGAYGTNRINGSGLNQYNKNWVLSQNYHINGELQLYHVLGPPPGARAQMICQGGGGLTQTATNQRILDMQSAAYFDIHNCSFSTSASQDATHPLVDNDFDGVTTAGDLAPQFTTCYNCTLNGNGVAAVLLQGAKSGGGAQYSNEYCLDCEMIGSTQACYQIGTASNLADNALAIGYSGDMQSCTGNGLAVYGGGYVSISAGSNGMSTMENGFATQTGFDIFGSAMQGPCVVEHFRSESRKFASCPTLQAKDVMVINQATTPIPGNSDPVGTYKTGSYVGGDGAWYKVTVDGGPYSGAGTTAAPLLASSGSGTTLVDTNNNIPGSVTIGTFVLGETVTQASTGSTGTITTVPTSFSTITGTLTSGTFQNGETVTQATTGITATFFGVGTSTAMFVKNLSGTADNSHTWTGAISGATFNPSTAPVASAANPVLVISSPTGSPDGTHNWTGGSSSAVYVPSGAPTPQAAWTVNAFAGMFVSVLSGTNALCYGVITSNTATAVTFSGGWVTRYPFTSCASPDSTSSFLIEPGWSHSGTVTSGGMTLQYSNENTIQGETVGGAVGLAAGSLENVNVPGGQVALGAAPSSHITIKNLTVSRSDWYSGVSDPQSGFPDRDWDVNVFLRGGTKPISWAYPAITGTPYSGALHRDLGAKVLCWSAGTIGLSGPSPANTSANDVCIGGRSDLGASTNTFRSRVEIFGGLGPAVPTGTDQNGTDFLLLGGGSTGAGTPGSIQFAIGATAGSSSTPNTGSNRWRIDGATGHLFASTDNTNDIGATGANRPRNLYLSNSVNVQDPGPFGSMQTQTSAACETSYGITTLGTGATTTDTGLNCLPANSVVDAIVYRITTTITTSANFTIGDATTAARFCGTQSTLTSGTTGICFVQADQTGAGGPRQASAAKVRVTLNANPGAGAIRLIVYYHTWTAPTS